MHNDIHGLWPALLIPVTPDGALDTKATAASAPALVAAGVTDVRVTCSLPRDIGRAGDLLHELVEAFRSATD